MIPHLTPAFLFLTVAAIAVGLVGSLIEKRLRPFTYSLFIVLLLWILLFTGNWIQSS